MTEKKLKLLYQLQQELEEENQKREKIEQFKKEIEWHYYSHLSDAQKKSVVNWICEELAKEWACSNNKNGFANKYEF